MRKLWLLAGVAMSLSMAAYAAPQRKTEVRCAVMSDHKVNIAEATKSKMFADYKGRRYFFCCAGCPAEFKKDPAKYAKSDSIPIPKAPKSPKKS